MALSLDRPVALSKLDAVNIVLAARGHAPATQLGEGSLGSTLEAEAALASTSLAVQTAEWSFNKDDMLKLDRNSVGEVFLPENTLSFEPTGSSEHLNLAQRGSRLYDRDKSTFTFEEDVYVSITLALAFEDLPQPARWYITMVAAFQYGNQTVPGSPSLRPTQMQVEEARIALDRYDNKNRQRNLRATNPHFKRLRKRR